MQKKSAGFLMYRSRNKLIEVLLVHPGGPFWVKKDIAAWSIPKGEFTSEDPLAAAKREFLEETGLKAEGDLIPLTPIKQPSGKKVFAWAFTGDCDPAQVKSNTFSMEWPRGSGELGTFPEIDQAKWFLIEMAKEKILRAQLPFLVELEQFLQSN